MIRFRPYDAKQVDPAYSLRFVWFAWLTAGIDSEWPIGLSSRIEAMWESDGLRVLSAHRKKNQVAVTFSAKPSVCPILLAQRAKGRLSYQLRKEGIQHEFSRKFAVRSIGENTNSDVAIYIAGQIKKEQFVDPRFAEMLSRFCLRWDDVDLSLPWEAKRSRYWYDLHLVLVTEERFRISAESIFERILERLLFVRDREGHLFKSLQLMPDHLHLLLRANVEHSPAQVSEMFQNETANAIGFRVWKDTYYVGTTGEYNMNAIRHD